MKWAKPIGDKCVLTGCDAAHEWMLKWFYENYKKHNTFDLIVADFGNMSNNIKSWCSLNKIRIVTPTSATGKNWFKKPEAILMCEYKRILWIDSDCEILSSLSEHFEKTPHDKIGLTIDKHRADIRGNFKMKDAYASGLVVVNNGNNNIIKWASLSLNPKTTGDQELLNAIIKNDPSIISILPPEFQWLRLDGNRKDVKVMHHTGPTGKQYIKSTINCDVAFVVGGGPSLRGYNFSKLSGLNTIVSNNAVFDVPNPKHFITVDYTFLMKNRQRIKGNYSKNFVVNMDNDSLKMIDGMMTDTRFNLKYDLTGYDAIYSTKSSGIGKTKNDFRNGTNSGYCAMQLAHIMGYKTIYLLGIDLNYSTNAHYHNGPTSPKMKENLESFYKYFVDGIKTLNDDGVKVISCSSTSRLNNIISYSTEFGNIENRIPERPKMHVGKSISTILAMKNGTR